jgi:hypothetical protein
MSPGVMAALGAARAGIEFSWRFSWAAFLLMAVGVQGFPPGAAAFALVASALLHALAARRNWRRLWALLLRLAVFAGCALLTVHRLWPAARPPWYLPALAVACLWLLWNGGRAAARDPRAQIPLDRGIGLFLLLLLIRLVVWVKGGTLPEVPATGWLLCALFASGLAAIGLQRAGEGPMSPSARRGLGLLLALAISAVLLASGLALRGYGRLTGAADSLLPPLEAAARPVGRAVSAVLLFLFSPKNLGGASLDAPSPGGPGPGGAPPPAAVGLSLARVIGLGLTALVALVGVAALALLVLQLARWLLRRVGGGKTASRRAPRMRLTGLLAALLRLPAQLWGGLAAWLKGCDRAAHVFGALLRWGSRSGLSRSASETPAEYGARVARCFPRLAREIGLIVEGFQREVYGGRPTERGALSCLRAARRRLLGPRHWPARLRLLLLGDDR